MKIALQVPARGVTGGHDPRARFTQLGQLRAQLGVQARVLQREPGCRARGLQKRPLVDQHRVVDEHGERSDRGQRAAWRGRVERQRRARSVT